MSFASRCGTVRRIHPNERKENRVSVYLLDGRGVSRRFTTLSGDVYVNARDITSGQPLQLAVTFSNLSDRKEYKTEIPALDTAAAELGGMPARLLVKGTPSIDRDRVNFRPAELALCMGTEAQTPWIRVIQLQLHFNGKRSVYPTF